MSDDAARREENQGLYEAMIKAQNAKDRAQTRRTCISSCTLPSQQTVMLP